ncbi:alpha-amylase family glycosyl hydrolase [uncultured Draconibacterium sp.]|uniref:alpha-amylase family glycosyl hydrolase n=1 Tax=uncultured Draconibacterium sp. TaxID=1573823 RepID=UPI002AA7E932|nr:alpha-amylase family glycosyl hydrolase [uncultured Draconibacterium sp.]
MKNTLYLIVVLVVGLSIKACKSGEQSEAQRTTENEVVQYGTPFDKVPDRRDVTMYQVNMRVFSEEGNFQGVTERLDSIKSLGANVVYLMPIYPVGEVRSVNSPYCITDYSLVNPEFGTLDDLRTLVEDAHNLDMAVILDWVANHTAFDNVWIADHKDWYMQDSTGNIINPPGHNWNDVAQLDFSNQEMRLEMIQTMKNWVLKANVDGFRCDYADGPPFDFWKQAIDTLRNIPGHDLLLMAEGSRNDHYKAGFDYNFGFNFFGNLKRIFERGRSVTSIEALNVSDYEGSSTGQQIIRYTSNHDVNGSDGTPLELFGGEKGSMAAFVVAAYMKSVPMIYNGQEVGTPYRLTFPFTSATIDWSINPHITAEYKKVIAFRNESDAIRRGELTSFCNDDVCAFTKKYNDEEVLVLVNLRDKKVDFDLDSTLKNTEWTDSMNGAKLMLSDQVLLESYEYIVLSNQ